MDGLILNITDDNDAPASVRTKKGGRWTERLKARRVTKRKLPPFNEKQSHHEEIALDRPAKRPRTEKEHSTRSTDNAPPSKHPTQIISSLFSSNPTLPEPLEEFAPRKPSKPSNAPIDTSTFEGLGLSPLIISHLSTKMSITKPTAIQRTALPMLFDTAEHRDAFIQSQTGSGKTLSYLLPIIQDLLPLSSLSYIDRSIGTLAVIIAPTRELAKQISDVVESLLQMRLRPTSDTGEEHGGDFSSQRLTRWLVSGLLTGGATRAHEKARLRKGTPILVSTPGRLLDHLQKTASFSIGKCRWLVLDEADRLMDLGFEETIQGILKGLDGRQKLAVQAENEGTSTEVRGWDWKERRNILCSATIREDVQKLAGLVLKNPLVIKALGGGPSDGGQPDSILTSKTNFTPPSQLSQKYAIIPLKLRLVTLVALLRSLLASHRGNKIIVFLSCTDSVDFHWRLLGDASMDDEGTIASNKSEGAESKSINTDEIKVQSPLLPDAFIYRLHGSLPLQTRLAAFKDFTAKPSEKGSNAQSSVLLCTSVASRGLDLPLVRAVVQLDLPTEGGANEYIHRVGRTARVGKGGEAWSIVAPTEEKWVRWVQERSGNDEKPQLHGVSIESILRDGFGGQGKEYEVRATQVQLAFERWVLRKSENTELARKAYLSHMRAYATHPSDEKHIFHIRHLHLGHLAKAFALREAPNTVTGKITKKSTKTGKAGSGSSKKMTNDTQVVEDAEQRMIAAVRSQGRLSRKDGSMVTTGASEFQIASTTVLEKMVK